MDFGQFSPRTLTTESRRSSNRLVRWIMSVRPGWLGAEDRPSRPNAALPGLRLAAHCLEASMQELRDSRRSGSEVDLQRLFTASYSAGRLVGYMEALAAADSTLARTAAAELEGAMQAVDAVRETFRKAP